jgi:S1-C subfamily serine protease
MLQKIQKNKKIFFILISVLVLLVAIPLFIRIFHNDSKPLKRYMTDEISEKDADINLAIDVVSPSSTKIESGAYMGSGNIWEITGKKIKIVTASHVAAEDNCTITFFDGAICEGAVTFRDDVKDIALIEVDRASLKNSNKKDATSYRSVRPSKELPDCEEQIFI